MSKITMQINEVSTVLEKNIISRKRITPKQEAKGKVNLKVNL